MRLAVLLFAGFCTMSAAKVARSEGKGMMTINSNGGLQSGIASAAVRRVGQTASNIMEPKKRAKQSPAASEIGIDTADSLFRDSGDKAEKVARSEGKRMMTINANGGLQSGIASAAVRRVGQTASNIMEPKNRAKQRPEASEIGIDTAESLFRDSGDKADSIVELGVIGSTLVHESEQSLEAAVAQQNPIEADQAAFQHFNDGVLTSPKLTAIGMDNWITDYKDGGGAGADEEEERSVCAEVSGYKCQPGTVRSLDATVLKLDVPETAQGEWGEFGNGVRFTFQNDVSDCAKICDTTITCKAFETYDDMETHQQPTTCQFMSSNTVASSQTSPQDGVQNKRNMYSKNAPDPIDWKSGVPSAGTGTEGGLQPLDDWQSMTTETEDPIEWESGWDPPPSPSKQ